MKRNKRLLCCIFSLVLGLAVTGVQAAPAAQKVTFEKLDSISGTLTSLRQITTGTPNA